MLKKERYTNDGVAINPIWNDPYYAVQRTDWQDAFFGTGNVLNGDIRITGGNDKSSYMSSLSYFDEKGTVDNTEYQRIVFRANSDHQLTSRLKLSQSFQFLSGQSGIGLVEDAHTGGVWQMLRFNPAIPVKNDDGTWGTSQADTELGDINNTIYEVNVKQVKNKNYSILGSVNLTYNILDGLYLNVNGSVNGGISTIREFSPQMLTQARIAPNATLWEKHSESSTYLTEAYLSYLKTFASVHKLNVTAGVSYQYYDGSWFDATKLGFSDEDPSQVVLDNGATMSSINGNYNDEVKLASAYGRLFYSYVDKYLLTATFRADGSSRFAPGRRWGYFPAVSAGWRLSQEGFMRDVEFLNDLKLIGGWGLLGNQNVGAFQYFAMMSKSGASQLGQQQITAAAINMLPNPLITWEKTSMTNISAEARMLDNKLGAGVTWYNKKTIDMLIATIAMGSQGNAAVPASNIGEMSNKGWEVELSYNDAINEEFSYSIAANAAFNKNKVDVLYGTDNFITGGTYGRTQQEISRTYEGQPIASFYGWQTNGLYQNQSEVDNDPNIKNDARKSGINPGDVRFVDQNGDGIIDEQDRTRLGDPNPDVIFGIQAGIAYKGFDLAINGYGNLGYELFNADRMTGLDPATSYNMYAEALNRWHGEGTSNSIPRMASGNFNQNHRTSDLFIESGNFFKIKNLTLGYTLPAPLTAKLQMNTLRIYFSGEDLYTFTHYTGFTPELGYHNGNQQKGVDWARVPTVRRLSLGLTLNF
jgi:TonB-linked SusC/RagA family outer membrane protein